MRWIPRPSRKGVAAGVLLVALVVTFGAFLPESAEGGQCYDYPNSRLVVRENIPACGGWGTHCIECVAGGASCIGDAGGNNACLVHEIPAP